jgi:hypothetical protein
MFVGAFIGGITASVGFGAFEALGGIEGGLLAGAGAGAAGGATAGLLSTFTAGGGKYFKNITSGAFFGAVAGAVTGGLIEIGHIDGHVATMAGAFTSGTMKGGFDDGLIAVAYAAGAMAVGYVAAAATPKTPNPFGGKLDVDGPGTFKVASSGNSVPVPSSNKGGSSFVDDMTNWVIDKLQIGVQINAHIILGGGALTVTRTLTGDWTVVATGRIGPGAYFGVGAVGAVGNAGQPSIGGSAAAAIGLRSAGWSFAYGSSGIEGGRSFGGVGYGVYFAPFEFNLKLF